MKGEAIEVYKIWLTDGRAGLIKKYPSVKQIPTKGFLTAAISPGSRKQFRVPRTSSALDLTRISKKDKEEEEEQTKLTMLRKAESSLQLHMDKRDEKKRERAHTRLRERERVVEEEPVVTPKQAINSNNSQNSMNERDLDWESLPICSNFIPKNYYEQNSSTDNATRLNYSLFIECARTPEHLFRDSPFQPIPSVFSYQDSFFSFLNDEPSFYLQEGRIHEGFASSEPSNPQEDDFGIENFPTIPSDPSISVPISYLSVFAPCPPTIKNQRLGPVPTPPQCSEPSLEHAEIDKLLTEMQSNLFEIQNLPALPSVRSSSTTTEATATTARALRAESVLRGSRSGSVPFSRVPIPRSGSSTVPNSPGVPHASPFAPRPTLPLSNPTTNTDVFCPVGELFPCFVEPPKPPNHPKILGISIIDQQIRTRIMKDWLLNVLDLGFFTVEKDEEHSSPVSPIIPSKSKSKIKSILKRAVDLPDYDTPQSSPRAVPARPAPSTPRNIGELDNSESPTQPREFAVTRPTRSVTIDWAGTNHRNKINSTRQIRTDSPGRQVSSRPSPRSPVPARKLVQKPRVVDESSSSEEEAIATQSSSFPPSLTSSTGVSRSVRPLPPIKPKKPLPIPKRTGSAERLARITVTSGSESSKHSNANRHSDTLPTNQSLTSESPKDSPRHSHTPSESPKSAPRLSYMSQYSESQNSTTSESPKSTSRLHQNSDNQNSTSESPRSAPSLSYMNQYSDNSTSESPKTPRLSYTNQYSDNQNSTSESPKSAPRRSYMNQHSDTLLSSTSAGTSPNLKVPGLLSTLSSSLGAEDFHSQFTDTSSDVGEEEGEEEGEQGEQGEEEAESHVREDRVLRGVSSPYILSPQNRNRMGGVREVMVGSPQGVKETMVGSLQGARSEMMGGRPMYQRGMMGQGIGRPMGGQMGGPMGGGQMGGPMGDLWEGQWEDKWGDQWEEDRWEEDQ
eukprot:TRINITY_DN1402_c0_g1_i5.p1 TRINITY_DN1402_c0_g1~~TRINITY_DN1402_c0_g1_i5.p1  ORF type:complete len:1072 (-),score=169.00 TRINITY_DN1402_c0_g1_i5:532-3408(-)